MKTSAQHFPIWSLNLLSEQTLPKQVQCQMFILRIKLYSKQYISKEDSDLDIQLHKKSQIVRTVFEQLKPMSMSKGCICPSGSILAFFSCSSPGFVLPDISIPLQVLEYICHRKVTTKQYHGGITKYPFNELHKQLDPCQQVALLMSPFWYSGKPHSM